MLRSSLVIGVLAGALCVSAGGARAQGGPDEGEDTAETIDLSEPAKDAPAAASADDGGDTSETIDLGDGPAAPAPTKPEASDEDDADDQSLEAHGWSRLAGLTGLARDGFYKDAPDPTAVPFERAVLNAQLLLRMRYARGAGLEVVLEGLLDYGLFEQDAPSSRTWSGFNGQATRTSYRATLREAYLGKFWPRFDLRVGQQRLAWGHSEFVTPNDVINPTDTTDPLLAETELRHLPSFMLRGDIALGDTSTLGLVFQPFFVPDRFDVYGSNWSIIQPDAPQRYRGLLLLTSPLVDPTLQDAVQPLLRQGDPAVDLDSAQAGARLTYRLGDLDVSHYYHYGYSGAPVIHADPVLAAQLDMVDWNTATLDVLQPFIAAVAMGGRPFETTYVRRHHVGLDAQASLGSQVVRLDAAWDSATVLTRRDLEGLDRPTATAVLGLESQPGHRKFIILEAIYRKVFDSPEQEELLGAAPDSVAVAALVRWPLGPDWEIESRTLVGITPFEVVSRSSLGWHHETLSIRAGFLYLRGEEGTVSDYYARNTSAFLLGKYTF